MKNNKIIHESNDKMKSYYYNNFGKNNIDNNRKIKNKIVDSNRKYTKTTNSNTTLKTTNTYSWYFDGKLINEYSKGLLARVGVYADGSLMINKLEKKDGGWYRCEKNVRGLNGLMKTEKSFVEKDYDYDSSSFVVEVYLNVTC